MTAPPTPTPSRRPNVLMIVMDTTRADRLSVNGYALDTTPNLRALASNGVTFTSAWSPAGWTAPAHATLFTGLRPEHHGLELAIRGYLTPDVPTLAEILSQSGYETACFSNNDYVCPESGLTRGFGRFDPLYDMKPQPPTSTGHSLAADWALEVHRRGVPFFAFINDMDPHEPYHPAREFALPFLPGDTTQDELNAGLAFDFKRSLGVVLGRVRLGPREIRILSSLYDGEVASLDHEIGALLARLNEASLLDDTVVVVVADHGENLGEHGLFDHKFSLHRTVCHIPLVIRFPGGFSGGRVVSDVVRLEDVLPTVLELTGVAAPPGLDGATLSGIVSGRISRAVWGAARGFLPQALEIYPDADPAIFNRSYRAVFDGTHHLIASSDGALELYDLATDPGETRNIAVEEPEECARLQGLLAAR
ncbi:MAG: sulfatase [Acidobacteriota bacterium]